MSTVAANKLSNVSKTKQIDVDALIDKANSAASTSDLADSSNASKGAGMLGYRGDTVFNALSWVMSPRQFKLPSDADDTASFKRMYTAISVLSGIKPIIALSGVYTVVGGFEPTTYEWSNVTFMCHGATINASALTGDNGVLQVGSAFTQIGHLDIAIAGTTAGGNGFVRTGVTIGRWWNAAQRVENFHLESIKVTTSTGVNGVAISGSSRHGYIGRLGIYGSFANGLLVHWSGLPNDISPTSTYHPHGIIIDEVYGNSATVSLVTFSAAYGITINRLSGDDNAKNLMSIAGDWGAVYANATESPMVGRGLKVVELALTNTRDIGILIIGQPGLIAGNTLDMPVDIGTGFMSGAAASSQGILHSNTDGGTIGSLSVSGFTNGVFTGAFVFNTIFKGTKAINNRLHGFRISGTADTRKGIVLDSVVAKNNNTLAAGGIAQIELGSTADGVYVINPKLSSNNAASHGIHLAGTAKNCVIESPIGEGFTGARYVVLNECGSDNNNIIRGVRADSVNILTPSSTPVLIRIDGIGRRVFAADAIPTVGTFVQGDKVEFNRSQTLLYEGATCITSGTPGTWKKFGALEP